MWLSGCIAPRLKAGPAIEGQPAESAYLVSTEAIDSEHALVVAEVEKLLSPGMSDREKAVRIHDFVRDEIRFGWQTNFYEVRASEVLTAGIGYCNTKSTLFVAMLRAAGIPARPYFVDLDAQLLDGIVNPGTAYVDHSFTEVFLGGRWVRTDSYIVDPTLFASAQARLQREGRTIGYGIHLSGTTAWDGVNDAFSQFVNDGSTPGFSTRDYGVHVDVLTFYRDEPTTWNKLNPGTRLLMRVGLPQANRTADSLRKATAIGG
ncbi:MAG: transglutaminase-like domain-containing protein [Planctomycetota bacterium]